MSPNLNLDPSEKVTYIEGTRYVVLHKDNREEWANRTKIELRRQGLWDVVKPEIIPTRAQLADQTFKANSEKAQLLLCSIVNDQFLKHIINKTSYEAWK